MRRLVLLLLPLLATAARAQDAERLSEPHPLREMLTETLRSQQMLALQRMVDAQRALAHARAVAYVDLDQDGEGELPTLPEALGLVPWRGSQDPAAGVVGWGDAILHDDGVVEAAGYLYRVVLPDADGNAAASLDAVSPDHAEREALVYAWPVRHGLSGRWTFGVHVTRGALLGTDAATYSGRDAPPGDDALLTTETATGGRRGLAAPLVEGGTGRDGRTWAPVREIIPQLRADEPDLSVPDSIGAGRAAARGHWVMLEREKLWKAVLAVDTTPRPDRVEPSAPHIRVATPQEIGAAIAAELRFPMERTGQWERQNASFALVGATTPAKFVESERVVLLCPETLAIVCRVADVADAHLADVLRLLIVHEMAHSLDFQTYPLRTSLNACTDEASIAAWSAVVEGHAQQVTRRAAEHMNLRRAFQALLRLTSADDDATTAAPAEARAAMQSLAFPYEGGERFMDAVRERWGTQGVAEVLRNPPTRPMLIETPESFFARGRGSAPIRWTEIMEALVELEPPGADVKRSPVLRRTLREMLAAAPELDADAVVAGVIDVESRVAAAPDGRTQAASTVLLCRDAQAARAYVVASRALQAAQDTAYEQNPLVDPDVTYAAPPPLEGVTAGYRVRKVLRSGGSTVNGLAVSVAAGRWVVEAAVTRLDARDEEVDRRLVRAVAATLQALPGR